MSHHQSHIDDRVISMIIMDKTIHLHMSGSVCHARCSLLDLHLFKLFTAVDSLKSLQFLLSLLENLEQNQAVNGQSS